MNNRRGILIGLGVDKFADLPEDLPDDDPVVLTDSTGAPWEIINVVWNVQRDVIETTVFGDAMPQYCIGHKRDELDITVRATMAALQDWASSRRRLGELAEVFAIDHEMRPGYRLKGTLRVLESQITSDPLMAEIRMRMKCVPMGELRVDIAAEPHRIQKGRGIQL